MKLKTVTASGILTAALFSAGADYALPANSRHGLFNGLDHRSTYGRYFFPEPLLAGETDVDNEVRLDWLHTEANAQQTDNARLELEKSFGLMTLELEVPYESTASAGQVTEAGIGNIDIGARHPFYQFVSAKGFFDLTLGAAFEIGIPVNSAVSKNAEVVPKIFNDLKMGEHFTLQSLLGYSTFLGGGAEGGLQTFEYGLVFGWTIQHEELPLSGVRQIVPLFELKGETQMNHDNPGSNRLLGDAGFRFNLKTIGKLQPRLGLGFVFPLDNNARAEVHWGIVTSLVFEY